MIAIAHLLLYLTLLIAMDSFEGTSRANDNEQEVAHKDTSKLDKIDE